MNPIPSDTNRNLISMAAFLRGGEDEVTHLDAPNWDGAPTLQEKIDRYTEQADALVARRRLARASRHYAAQLARVPLGQRISPTLKAVPTQEDA